MKAEAGKKGAGVVAGGTKDRCGKKTGGAGRGGPVVTKRGRKKKVLKSDPEMGGNR